MTEQTETTEHVVSTRDLAQAAENGRPEPDAADVGDEAKDDGTPSEPLLATDDSERYRSRWHEIQAGFVDEPQRSVEEADKLVADLMQRLAAVFSDERARLEAHWDKGDDVSTEDLRVALTRYRSFFARLLTT